MSTFWKVPESDSWVVIMGFRFRRSISIIPGLKLNLSKSGISTSIGGRGATINFGRHGTRATFGIPGTGLSYSTMSPSASHQDSTSGGTAGESPRSISGCGIILVAAIGIAVIGVIISSSTRPSRREAVEARPELEKLQVSATALNCRAGPALSEPGIAMLTKGQVVSVYQSEREKDWVQLDLGTVRCWAVEHYLSRPALH